MNKPRIRNIAITMLGLFALVGTQVYFNQKTYEEKRAREAQERRELPPKLAALIASKVNEGAPRMVDEVTRLDRAEASSDGRVITRLTIVPYSRTELDKTEIFKIRGSVITQLCDSEARKVLAQGVTFQQEYRDRDGKTIMNIIIDNAVCLSPRQPEFPLDLMY